MAVADMCIRGKGMHTLPFVFAGTCARGISLLIAPFLNERWSGVEIISMSDETWTTFYFVRHGETVWNSQGRWQGWQDSPLTETGRQQAAAAADTLHASGASQLFTSDAGRARQTAEIIGTKLGLQSRLESSLRERFYGEYEGMTSDEIDAKFPNTRYLEGRDLRDTWRPIGGETLVEVGARVLSFIRAAAAEFPGETVVAVTHAGVLRVLDSVSSGETMDNLWHRVPPNCGIFQLQANAAGDVRVVAHFCETL